MDLKKPLAGAISGMAILAGAQAALAGSHGGEITVACFIE